jgi:hypothetical protein
MTAATRTAAEPVPHFACGTCGSPLDRYAEFPSGIVSFEHPIGKGADHPPVPVDADTIDTAYVCDFCSDPRILFAFTTSRPIQLVVDTGDGTLVRDYGTQWSACFECAELVESQALPELLTRIMTQGEGLPSEVAPGMRGLLREVLATLLPGRSIAAIGRWEPHPLPATNLPKVRDRLADLIGGNDELPFGIGQPAIREPLAASLATTRLYWIDDDFTELTRQAARTMPRIAFSPTDLPAAHGFAAWAQPVDDRRSVAASWSSHGDAVHLVGYRSVGAGLPSPVVQRLRADIGWLIPAFAVTLRPGQPHHAGHPAAALTTTWRLIRQRLAETRPAKVDKPIRKSYRRAARPEPEVQLVSIRGTHTRPAGHSVEPGRSGTATEREFRVWVTPHWRLQPYGPGRTLRDWIIVRPHLRGPENKPIKASTTVRILGDLPPRPDSADPEGLTNR